MTPATLNLGDLVILVADPSSYTCTIIHGMLRGFGANKVLDAKDSLSLFRVLSGQKVDILICDARLPANDSNLRKQGGGLALTRAIRRNTNNENRTIPILLMASDTRETTIKSARDVGANMLIAKPISPAALYDRLTWIAFNPRQFVDTANYFGPDRRFKIEGYPGGIGRRKGDKVVEVAAETGPALAQDDIDNFFNKARTGQD